jgi:prolyl oligopeptidase
MKSVLYKIGDDPEKLNVILSAETNPELNIAEEDFPIVNLINKNDKYLIGYIGGASAYSDAYFTRISDIRTGNLIWKPLYKKELKIYNGFFKSDEYVYMTANNSPNFKIASIKVEQPDFNNPEILVNENKDEVVDDFYITSDGMYYVRTINGVEAKLYYYNGKNEKNIELPKRAGRIRLSCKGIEYPDIWINTAGWTYDYQRFRYDQNNDEFVEENLVPTGSFPEFEDFVVKEVLVKSYDGEEVPLSIIHKKNIEMNGMNPTLLYGYGSYSYSLNPWFSRAFLTWVDEGGIFCLAHVRGGGEKGDAWHYGGFKQTKYNTWKDLIACTEYMINEGYTSNKHTIINSASAGGILIGRAMTERPDLFAVAIAEVGVMNMLRFEETPNGPNNTKEFGTVKDSSECMALIEMDSYLKIRKGENYPATLITTGMNDPRVIAWQPAKFAAKLQAFNGSNNPIIFQVDYESGHGINDIKLKQFEQTANIFSFAFWQTGNKKYKLIIE